MRGVKVIEKMRAILDKQNEEIQKLKEELRIVEKANLVMVGFFDSFSTNETNETKVASNLAIQQEKGETNLKNIGRRPDGRWCGRKTIKGKKITVYAKTQKECYNKLMKAIKLETQEFKYPNEFPQFAMYWFTTYKENNIAQKSEETYLAVIKNDLTKINCTLDELNIDILQKFINTLPPTRKRELVTMILKQITRKAYELDLIKKDYGQFVSKGKIMRKKIQAFTLEQQKLILNNLKDDFFSLTVYTLLLTGCRPNELQTIKQCNIKKNLLLVEGTKTANARRWIKISDWLQNKLLEEPEEIIFKKYNFELFRKQFKKFLEKLGIKGSPYMLRHTFATNLFYLGVPDRERQSYMGHFSSVLTNDVYTDFDPTTDKKDILNLYINLLPQF